MFDLFRFIALRPPQATAQDGNLAIDGQSAFQTSLRSARAGNDPQTEMKKLAQSFVESEDFVKSSASLNTGRQLQELKVALNRGEKIGLEDLKQLVEHTFQKP